MRHTTWLYILVLLICQVAVAAELGQGRAGDLDGDQPVKANFDAYFYPANEYRTDPRLPKFVKCLTVVDVSYLDYDGIERKGRLIVNKDAAMDVKNAFGYMKKIGYRVKSISPINNFNWSDDASMEKDNTSAYNFRSIKNTQRLSHHAFGYALDLNPKCNPDVRMRDGAQILDPPSATYPTKSACAIEGPLGSQVKDYFLNTLKWCWGGDYSRHRDLQHFEKPPTGMSCENFRRMGSTRDPNGPVCD